MKRPPHKCDYCFSETDIIEIGYICVDCKKVYDLKGSPWFIVPSTGRAEQLRDEYGG